MGLSTCWSRLRQGQRALLAGWAYLWFILGSPCLACWPCPTTQQTQLKKCECLGRGATSAGPQIPQIFDPLIRGPSQVIPQLGQRSTRHGRGRVVKARGSEKGAGRLEAASREEGFIFCLPWSPQPLQELLIHQLQPPQKMVRKVSWGFGTRLRKC